MKEILFRVAVRYRDPMARDNVEVGWFHSILGSSPLTVETSSIGPLPPKQPNINIKKAFYD